MTLPKNGAAFKWAAGILAIALIGAGSVALNHERRITTVETSLEIELKGISQTLLRLETKMNGGW